MSNNKVKNKKNKNELTAVNGDGKEVEIEVSFEIAEFDKKDFWKQDYQKRKRKQQNSIEEMLEFNETVWNHETLDAALTAKSPENHYIENFKNELFKKALDTLSEKQKERLLLHFLDKLSFAKIGRLEGISRKVANRNVKEAVEKLKKFFENNSY